MTNEDTLQALKIAFTFMPKPIEVTQYEFGDRAELVQSQIQFVRETLLEHGIDPDEVSGDINPDITPNSCY